MSEGEFRSVNNIPPRMLVKAGSVLLVPRQGQRDEDVAPILAENGQLSLAAEPTTPKTAKGKAKAKGQHASGGQKSGSSQEVPKVAVNPKLKSKSNPKQAQAQTGHKVAGQ
jgi:hypothetical protein